MPIGSYANLYYIAKELEFKAPKSVLDLGIGLGMNGVLVQHYVDKINGGPTRIVGIEINAYYSNPLWDVYTRVWCITIERYLDTRRETFDFILMTDVIEHFPKETGTVILNRLPLLLNPGGTILISTPGVFVQQDDVHGNSYERHLSFFGPDDFPPGYFAVKTGVDYHGDQTTIMLYQK